MTVQTRPVKKDRSTQILLFLATIVAIGGIAFAIGRLTASPAAAATGNNGNGGFNGEGFGGRFARGSFDPGQFGGGARLGGLGGGVEGTVESISGTTMTIKLANGNTATIDLNGSTTYHSETAATATDVKSGSKILVTIDTAAAGSQQPIGASPAPGASGAPGGFGGFGGGNRTITAKDIILVTP